MEVSFLPPTLTSYSSPQLLALGTLRALGTKLMSRLPPSGMVLPWETCPLGLLGQQVAMDLAAQAKTQGCGHVTVPNP